MTFRLTTADVWGIRKAHSEKSLWRFVRLMWPAVEPKRALVHGWAMEAICEHLEAVTSGEIKRLLINVPPGSSKALDDDTPVLTTWGWRRHGDLAAGDIVFGPDGRAKRVLAVTAPWVTDAFDVQFDDGASVVAAGDHLWAVERDVMSVAPRYTRGRKAMVVATSDLRMSDPQNGWTRRPDRIAVAQPIELPPKRLPIDPYLVGVWLGDGYTNSPCFCAADQDIEHFKAWGTVGTVYEPAGTRKQRFYRLTAKPLAANLRAMGLLGDKRIPDDYLESSAEQRWELLRGLMDTDGCATQSGNCTFVTKLPHLAQQSLALSRSLGLKATITSQRSVLNGKDYGLHYVMAFTAPAGAIVFKLRRKQERLHGHQNGRSRHRYVAAVTSVGRRSVRCIQVEGSIYLAGNAFVPTHNSLLTNVFYPAWEWGPCNLPHTRYLSASYSQSLTERDNVRMRQLIGDPVYRMLWGDRFTPGENSVKFSNNKTGWKIASSVGGTITGERADRVLVDDPNSVQEAESATVRGNVNRWMMEVLPTRLNDPTRSAIVVIQQRTHQEDATGTLLDPDRGGEEWVHLMIPMHYDPGRHCVTSIGWEDPRGLDDDGAPLPEADRWAREGQLYWPERFPPDEVEKLRKRLGGYAWAGQMQQIPTPRGGAIIKSEWWQQYGPDDPVANKVKFPRFSYVLASLDTAFTEREENDPSACVVLGIWSDPTTRLPQCMMVHAWQARLELHDLVVRVANTCERYKADVLLIENKASGLSVQQEIRRLYARAEFAVRFTDPTRKGEKVARAHSVTHIFEERMVHAPATDWADMVIQQCSVFPRGSHDDLVDALIQGLRYMRDEGLLSRRQEVRWQQQGIIEAARQGARDRPLYSA